MFVVKMLEPFPPGAQPFADYNMIDDIIESRGLRVNTIMCADCPPMSAAMEVPHYFAHVSAGLEILYRGQEEVQMCGIVKRFVHENLAELKNDTDNYLSHPRWGATSVVRYVNSMMKKFVPPSAALFYLMARACNSHTCVHFANCVWSTVHEEYAYYIAVDLAAVGDRFVMLESMEQEHLQVVVGEIKILVDPQEAWVDDECDSDEIVSVTSNSSDFVEPVIPQSCVQLKECVMRLKRLPIKTCFLQVYSNLSVLVEHLSRSLLAPGCIFRSERLSKSVLYPGCVFRGQYDWRQCTVPGKVFSSKEGPRDRLSVSCRKPGYVFSHRVCPMPNWSQCTVPIDKPSRTRAPGFMHQVGEDVPAEFDATLRCKCVEVRRECAFPTVTKFSCHVCKVAKRVEPTCAAIKRHVERDHGMFTCNNAHCTAGFRTADACDIHSAVDMKKRRVCPKCSAVFSHRFALERHTVLHQMRPQHQCDKCSKVYFRVQDLKEHVVTVHAGHEFPCHQCAYIGRSERALKQHGLTHEPPKLSCAKCSARFRWHSQLAAHTCE